MANPLFDLSGKVAVITGSSRGIGRSSAELLARLGARVVISSRKAEACQEVADGINQAGGEAIVIPCNISRRAEVEALIAGATRHFGKVDILVCNAAVNPYYGPLAEVPDEAFERVMTGNVRSILRLAAAVLPEMAARRDGAIVIVSSIAGLRGSPMIGTYGVSKAADMQLARSLAAEWGRHNIRVNCVAPGLIKTDFSRALWEDEGRAQRRIAETPLARLGEPADIVGAVILLASPAGRFITGQTIVVDGGAIIAG